MAEWQWVCLLACCSTITMVVGVLMGRCDRSERRLQRAEGKGVRAIRVGAVPGDVTSLPGGVRLMSDNEVHDWIRERAADADRAGCEAAAP